MSHHYVVIGILTSGPMAGKRVSIIAKDGEAPPLRYEERDGNRVYSYLRRDGGRECLFTYSRVYDYSHTRTYC
jgi:hypothetical protein